jgi:alcohol dehydrogenase class IV
MEMPNDYAYSVRMSPMKFGVGVSKEIGVDLRRMGIKSVLLVTDKILNKNTDIPKKIKGYIEQEGIKVEVYDRVEPEPSYELVNDALEVVSGLEVDAFVGVGGGSAMDVAKATSLYLTHPADFFDYIGKPFGKGKPIPPRPIKPVICVPTTAGTGAETTPMASFAIPEKGIKIGFGAPNMMPALAVVDPLNTVTMPPSVTVSTGVDALSHAFEAYTAVAYNARPMPPTPEERPVYVGANPVTDVFAERAIELIGKYFRRAVAKPNDIEARSGMSLAAFLAAVAFGNAGVHINHAISYSFPYERHLPHGIAVGLCFPGMVLFTAPILPEKHLKVAKLLGENVEGVSKYEAGELVYKALVRLYHDVGFPNGISEYFDESDIPEFVEKASKQTRLLSAACRYPSEKDLEEIFRRSFRFW